MTIMIFEFFAPYLAPAMFIFLFILFLAGYQIAFSLMSTGILFGLLAIEAGIMEFSAFAGIPENIWGRVMTNETLLAIPFFTLMGLILERCGMAENLLDSVAKLFGKVRGGLAYAVILVGTILAATTGIVAASVMAMGLIALPIMLRYGYDRKIACGTIAASGTLAQIVPPSLVLIVLADQLGKSVGDMYQGALLPSLLLVGFYCLYIFIMSILYPHKMPPATENFAENTPHKDVLKAFFPVLITVVYGMFFLFAPQMAFPWQILSPMMDDILILGTLSFITTVYLIKLNARNPVLGGITRHLLASILPPVILIFLVLGTIFRGIATPTEAGAAGAIGALLLALSYKKLSWAMLKDALHGTVKLSTFVMFVLIGARIFTLTFYQLNGHHMIEDLFSHLPGGALGFLIIVNIMIFFLAFFLDFFELAFIVVPLLVPIATKLGIDLIWFGVILGINLQTSFMHPPFGFSLFFLKSVAPAEDYTDRVTGQTIAKITTGQIYKGAIPFLFIQLFTVAVVIIYPELTMTSDKKIGDLNIIYKQIPHLPEPRDPMLFLK